MKYDLHIVVALILLVAATFQSASAALQNYTFDRYAPILERQPFGEAKAAVAPPQPTGPVAPPFTKDIKMCAITEDESGIQVGFVSVAVKPPKSYFLLVGETEDEITLVRADYDREMALLKKGEREEWISMAGPVDMAALAASDAPPSPAGAPKVVAKSGPSKKLSYSERLRRRRQQVLERKAPEPKLKGEALKKHLEEYQMELIRSGMPALPIPLTEEMDAQLVSEGVLPAGSEAEPAP